MVSNPVRIQVSNRPAGEPVWRERSAADDVDSRSNHRADNVMVPSNKPMARTNPGSFFVVPAESGFFFCAVSAFVNASIAQTA